MKKAYICVIITALLFGTMEVSCKIGGGALDPFQLTFLRFLIGGIILLPFAVIQIRKKGVSLTGRDFINLTVVGLLGVTFSMSLFQLSVMMSNASTASVLICVNPFFTMVFAHFLTKEKMNVHKFIILMTAMVGIVFMMRPWDIQEGNTMPGMCLMLASALLFGLYTIAGKVMQEKIGMMAQTSISFLAGSFVLMIIMIAAGRPVVEGISESIPIILYVGILVTGVGYYCYFRAIELGGATTGAFAFFLKPAIAPVIAVIVLHETILWNSVVGIGFVLTATMLNIVYQRTQINRKLAEERRQENVQKQ